MTQEMLKVHVNGFYLTKHRKFFNLEFSKFKNYVSGFVLCHRPTKVRATISDWKVMMIVAFQQNRIIAYQILPKNTNVNFEVYLNFLSQVLHREINKHRVTRPLIIHDNATPHKHHKVQEFLKRHHWEVLIQPAYSPDLNPCDFDGIARIKKPNKGIRFVNEDELRAAYDEVIKEINLKDEATGIRYFPERWAKVTQTGGEYIV